MLISSLVCQILIFHRLIQSMNKKCVLFYICLGMEQLLPTQALKRSISYIHPFTLTQQLFIHSKPGTRYRLLMPSGCQIGKSKNPHRCLQFNRRVKQVETIRIQSIHVGVKGTIRHHCRRQSHLSQLEWCTERPED